jgi:uncharacterized protein YjiS (DUF1127 family)
MQRVDVLRFSPATGVPSLRRVVQLIRLWQQRARTRRQLAALDDRQLADIGISHSERQDELSKAFWQ